MAEWLVTLVGLEMRGKNDAESRLSRKSLAGVYLCDNIFILKSPVMMQSLFLNNYLYLLDQIHVYESNSVDQWQETEISRVSKI